MDLVYVCYGLKRDRLPEEPYALLDAWVGHVVPTVLDAERGTPFLEAYARDDDDASSAATQGPGGTPSAARRQPSVAAVWGYGGLTAPSPRPAAASVAAVLPDGGAGSTVDAPSPPCS